MSGENNHQCYIDEMNILKSNDIVSSNDTTEDHQCDNIIKNGVMIDVALSDEDSLDNSNRPEMPWTLNAENLLNQWNDKAKISDKIHDKSGYHYKNLRKIWGIPAIILPGAMSPISTVFAETKWIKYVNMGVFMLVAMLSGVDTFFSFSTRKERHFNHSARYGELSTMVEGELNKPKKFRIQADVFMTTVRLQFDHLNVTAPIIPDNIKRSFERNEKFSEVVNVDWIAKR